VHDAAFPARTPATVRIRDVRGGVREMTVPTARGDPDLPFDTATLRSKHRRLLEPHAPRLLAPVGRLLDTDGPIDVDELVTACSPTDPRVGP
jgi:hypothetical protein